MTPFALAPVSFLVLALLVMLGQADHELCDRYQSHTSWPYTVNNNAWNRDDSGGVCTYVCDTCPRGAVSLYSLWNWTSEPPAVHAYPNIELRSDKLPLKLSELFSLHVAASWAFGPSTLDEAQRDPNTEPDASAIISNDVQANVVLDVFGDEDPELSQTPAQQGYEFMVWVGQFGNAAQPIGNRTPRDPPVVARLNDTDFTLYNGTNSNGQIVFSWIANHTLTKFDMDLAPLFGFLLKEEGVPEDIYLGTIQFGTETFFSQSQMNFSIAFYAAEIETTRLGSSAKPSASLPVATQVESHGAAPGLQVPIVGCGWMLWIPGMFFILGCMTML